MRVVHDVVRHHALGFVVVVAAGIHVPVEAGEIAARHLDAEAMPGRKVVAGGHRLQRNLVHLARFHPYSRQILHPVANDLASTSAASFGAGRATLLLGSAFVMFPDDPPCSLATEVQRPHLFGTHSFDA